MAELPPPPGPDETDDAYAIASAILAAIPVWGGPATELVHGFIPPPVWQRQEEWLSQLQTVVNDIARRVGNQGAAEALAQDSTFRSVVLQVCRAAVMERDVHRLVAFRNVIVNSAGRLPQDHAKIEIHLNLVRGMSSVHFRALEMVVNPRVVFTELAGGRAFVSNVRGRIEMEILGGDRVFIDQVLRDLEQNQLIEAIHAFRAARYGSVFHYKATQRGRELVSFIHDSPERLLSGARD